MRRRTRVIYTVGSDRTRRMVSIHHPRAAGGYRWRKVFFYWRNASVSSVGEHLPRISHKVCF